MSRGLCQLSYGPVRSKIFIRLRFLRQAPQKLPAAFQAAHLAKFPRNTYLFAVPEKMRLITQESRTTGRDAAIRANRGFFMNGRLRTLLLLSLLSALIVFLGGLMGGRNGILVALGFALLMNVGSYWYSDRIVLSMYRARTLEPYEAPALHRMVENLAERAGIPKPRLCVIPEEAPNAFATGRNPEHGVVAVTEGIMRLLSPEELEGVLAHEISHIANRDILIQPVAGVMASAVVSIANIMQFTAIFGLGRGDNEEGGGGNALTALLMAMLAPLAAGLIQMAVSRSREYLADERGAAVSGRPLDLASALAKLQSVNQRVPMRQGNASTASMFVVSPFSAGSMAHLFSTHPPVEERIARLQALASR